MDPERWKRVETLFHRCLERPASDRGLLLAEACAHDQAMRNQVEAMLNAEASEGWIREAVVESQPAEAVARKRVGPYRVVRELGRGGMGVVLLAERDDEAFQMQVAIKLVEGRLPGSEVEQRLRRERQISARLDHPNIARLLDGGTTRDGLPYFVMERVKGEPIDRYCQTHRLSLRQRLRLFHTLCGAVHFAHQRLVIHRDIKPSNILVTADGAPKLLDFGVAKLLAEDPDYADLGQTATGVRLLTPDYASPEQVRGETLTTASDIYSLGVLLFRLLTGEAPYRFADRRPTEVERVVCSVSPPAPSAAVLTSASSELALAKAELAQKLVGDLDTIVLAALRKDPVRRYSSVEQLADDIQRYLGNLPVRARPDTLRYRTGKFILRNRLAVLVASAVVLLLVVASGVTTWQARVAIEQRRSAEAESAKATTALEFLVDVFEVSDPGVARGRKVTAREVLDQGAQRVLERLEDQPEVRLTLLSTIGRVYQNLGIYDQAEQLFEEAAQLNRNVESIAALASVRFQQGHHEEAKTLFEETLAMQRHAFPPENRDLQESYAETLNDLAVVSFALGDFERAERLMRQSLKTLALFGRLGDVRMAEAFENLGGVRKKRNDLAGAERLLRRALASYQIDLGPKHPRIAGAMPSLAGILYQKGALEPATKLYRTALAMRLELFEEDHPDVTASMISLGSVLRDQGELDEAESLLRRATVLGRAAGQPGLLALAYSLGHLADLLRLKPDDETAQIESEQLYWESLEIRQSSLSPDHHTVANSLMGLARKMRDEGRCPAAVPLLQRAVSIRRSAFGDEHPATRSSRELLVHCQEIISPKNTLSRGA